eukprot:m.282963 g.282963  ORF g.282963 m.282963 type:complete len:107 (+) comp40665_c0_seq30:3787-4107(+)
MRECTTVSPPNEDSEASLFHLSADNTLRKHSERNRHNRKRGQALGSDVPVEAADDEFSSNVQGTMPKRKFQPCWQQDFDWLEYYNNDDYMTCKICSARPQLSVNIT